MRYGVRWSENGERERITERGRGCVEVQRKTSEEEARAVVRDTNSDVVN